MAPKAWPWEDLLSLLGLCRTCPTSCAGCPHSQEHTAFQRREGAFRAGQQCVCVPASRPSGLQAPARDSHLQPDRWSSQQTGRGPGIAGDSRRPWGPRHPAVWERNLGARAGGAGGAAGPGSGTASTLPHRGHTPPAAPGPGEARSCAGREGRAGWLRGREGGELSQEPACPRRALRSLRAGRGAESPQGWRAPGLDGNAKVP